MKRFYQLFSCVRLETLAGVLVDTTGASPTVTNLRARILSGAK
jgi:hypothetical protein